MDTIKDLIANPDLFETFTTQGLIKLAKKQLLSVSPKSENYCFNSALVLSLLAIAQGLNDLKERE